MTLNKILKLHHLNTLQKFQIRFYHSRLKLSHSMSAKVESVQTVRSGPSAADEVRRSIILDAKNRIPGKIYLININSFIDSKI